MGVLITFWCPNNDPLGHLVMDVLITESDDLITESPYHGCPDNDHNVVMGVSITESPCHGCLDNDGYLDNDGCLDNDEK